MLGFLRRHLGIKIFLSYLFIILIVVIVLAFSAELVIPRAFNNHMSAMMGNPMMRMMRGNMHIDLYDSFRNATNEALTRGTIIAFFAALVVSIFVSRQVVAPVQAMQVASQRIADGHYEQRVQVRSRPDEADELSQLAISFNQMAEKLAEIEEMRRKLIGDVSHELRTPLTTIQGSMEGLMDGVLQPNPETYQAVYREADRLKRLVDDLQELSRVESGAYQLCLAPISPDALVQSAVSRLALQFDEKGVALDIDLAPNLPDVLADEDRISQVLLNLVGNALQFTPSGGKVRLSTHLEEGFVHFVVADNGLGIPPEHLPHLFTRFYRVDKSRSRAGGGSGIGLTIARHLVEAHGGRVWAESPGAGDGSQFTFTLPLAT